MRGMSSTVGDSIRHYRKQLGWTQARLAAETCRSAGVPTGSLTKQEIYRYETSRRTPRDWLPAIASALGVPVETMTSPSRRDRETHHDASAPLPTLVSLPGNELALTIHELCRRLIVLDNTFHGIPIAETACRSFKAVHRRLGVGEFTGPQERDIQAAAAELAEISGWALFNEGYERQSRVFTQEAITLSRWAGDRGMELLATQNLALLAGSSGRPREELNLARSVLEAPRRVNPRVEAMFRAREGQGRRALGDPKATEAFTRARKLIGDHAPENGPDWAWWVTHREIDRQEGRVLCVVEDHAAAIPVLERASDSARGAHVGYALGSLVRLLESYLAVQAWGDAERVSHILLPVAAESSSGRIVGSLATLADAFPEAPDAIRGALFEIQEGANESPYELF